MSDGERLGREVAIRRGELVREGFCQVCAIGKGIEDVRVRFRVESQPYNWRRFPCSTRTDCPGRKAADAAEMDAYEAERLEALQERQAAMLGERL